MSKNNILIHRDFIVYRIGKYIKLIPPEKTHLYQDYHLAYNTGFTISQLIKLPFSCYFLNPDGTTKLINEEGAQLCGYGSSDDAVGKSLFDVSTRQSAAYLINNCKHVMDNQSIEIFDEINIRKDAKELAFLSVKSPWVNEDNQLIGIFGCSITIGKHQLAQSIAILKELSLLNAEPKQTFIKTISPILPTTFNVTPREYQCLKLLIRGYTAKRIGQHLGISPRTVEDYLNQLKSKFNVHSKSELIEAAIDYFMNNNHT